jgi:hypothetical protein
MVVSTPGLGPTDAATGIGTAGDASGDGAIAWVQGPPSSRQIVAALLYEPPGSFAPVEEFQYARTTQPVLSWSAARGYWGLRYLVSIDGAQAAQTTATSFQVPAALTEGPHAWQVTATNPAGQTSGTRAATVWVDTIAPVVQFTLTGAKRAGSLLHIYVAYTDAPPPPLPPADASGVASVLLKWGDGSSYRIRHGKFHIFRRPGRYRLTVTVTDWAGNATTVTSSLRIAPKHKPKKRKSKPGPTASVPKAKQKAARARHRPTHRAL